MDFLSKKARGIVPYTAGEQLRDRTYIKLNTNENPYPPAPGVKAALAAFDAGELRLYPRPNADLLRQTIAEKEGVEPENVFCGNGSDEVLALSFPAFFDTDGAGACFADLTYSFYEVFAAFFGIPVKIVPLLPDFTFDLAAMRDAHCQGYYIANPNAPTGVGISREKMEQFVASVPDKIVILDEAYMDFYGESCVPLTKKYENVLVVKTFSKGYSLAGMRCGYAVGDPALIDGLERCRDCFNSYPVDRICADGEYYARMNALVVAERERLSAELKKRGFTVLPSSANFVFARHPSAGGRAVYEALRSRGVLVRHFQKPRIDGFCRIRRLQIGPDLLRDPGQFSSNRLPGFLRFQLPPQLRLNPAPVQRIHQQDGKTIRRQQPGQMLPLLPHVIPNT